MFSEVKFNLLRVTIPKFFLISVMRIKRFLLRYYPPGIFIEYIKSNGDMLTKSIDLV